VFGRFIDLPGLGTFRKVQVTPVEDSASRLRAPQRAETGLWTYSDEDPPHGWPTTDWPTDTPDPRAAGRVLLRR
jgi:hypothetical protein